ncbi:MAG TPA: DUF4328 domain-containing protein [Pyrinomonadaceae bacterium]|jgi:hypothetical protein
MSYFQNRTAPAALYAGGPFVSAHGRATVVVVLFVAYVATALFSIVTNVVALAADPIFLDSEDGQQVTLYELLLFLSVLATFIVCAALVVAFLVWLYRVVKNVPALGTRRSNVEFSPVWAAGSFFVPFVNLVVPYRAVREVWVKSDPEMLPGGDFMFPQASSAPLVLGWWLAWLASNVLSNISWRLHDDVTSPGTLRFVAGFHILSHLAGVVAAVLAILVVRGIDRRQRERARHFAHVSHTPPPPPVFTEQHTPAV